MRLRLLFSVAFFFCGISQIYAQCSQATPYVLDTDGDGVGQNFNTTDLTHAGNAFTDFGETDILFGNIIMSCSPSPPSGYAILRGNYDCDDNNRYVGGTTTWYWDNDGDRTGGASVSCGDPVRSDYVTTSGDACDNDAGTTTGYTYYLDADDDGTGGDQTTTACSLPPGYSTITGDQCDNDAATTTRYTWYYDEDGDGYGGDTIQYSCTQPTDYVRNTDDLDDSTPYIIHTPPYTLYEDNDGDGYGAGSGFYASAGKHLAGYTVSNNSDCNDGNRAIHPLTVWYIDADGDSYGSNASTKTQCSQPTGYVLNRSDYDDSSSCIINVAPQTFYFDSDGDSYGDPGNTISCSSLTLANARVTGGVYVTNSNDCNDSDAVFHDFTTLYLDQDGDGFGYNAGLLATTNGIRNTPGANGPPSGVPLTITGCVTQTGGYSYVLNTSDYDDTDTLITNIQPTIFYEDADSDNYGNAASTVLESVIRTGYVRNSDDCDDTDNTLNPETPWFEDNDGDGYGNDTSVRQCQSPGSSYVRNTDDYDDSTINITNIAPRTFYRDADGDTYGDASTTVSYSVQPTGYVENDQDCDDTDAGINPQTVWYLDQDGDGYGYNATLLNVSNNDRSTPGASQPPTGIPTTVTTCDPTTLNNGYAYVLSSNDYDDTTSNITSVRAQNFYRDSDGDTYGDPNSILYYSNQPTGYVTNADDCNDTDAALNPDTLWYQDFDNDSYGDPNSSRASCTQPTGFVSNSDDRDDTTRYITNVQPTTFYRDADNDNYGNPNDTGQYSFAPSGYVSDNQDCNDGDPTLNPDTVWYLDQDGDGFGYNASLLSDSNTQRNIPGGNAPPTGIATTVTMCDPTTLNNGYTYVRNTSDYDDTLTTITNVRPGYFYQDQDGDSYGNASQALFVSTTPTGYVTDNQDCNDTDATLNPDTLWYLDSDGDSYGGNASVQQCDAPSSDYVRNTDDYDDTTANIINIAPRTFYRDADGDTYGDPSTAVSYSLQPTGYVENDQDCNDTDAGINPQTVWYLDQDGDGYGYNATLLNVSNNDRSTPGASQPPTGIPTTVTTCDPTTLNNGYAYVLSSNDYDDTTSNITSVRAQNFYRDSDGDTYGDPNSILYYSNQPTGYVTNADDCNDTDAALNPDTLWYQDFDNDSYGDLNSSRASCTQPTGFVSNSDDRDDTTRYITNVQPTTFYRDADNDSYGNPNDTGQYSFAPPGYVSDNEDCDDGDSALNPDTVWYLDQDGDGFGYNASLLSDSNTQRNTPGGNAPPTGIPTTVTMCDPTTLNNGYTYVRNTSDYDDTLATITNVQPGHFYRDQDSDTYGDPLQAVFVSSMPSGYVTDNQDCNDTDATLNPDTLWYLDSDGDSYGSDTVAQQCQAPSNDYVRNTDDYDDTTVNIINIAPQNFYRDADGDGYGDPNDNLYYSLRPTGYVDNSDDCNDTDAGISPDTLWYLDQDGDGLGYNAALRDVANQGRSTPNGSPAPTGIPTTVTLCDPTTLNNGYTYVLNSSDYDDTTTNISDVAPRYFYEDNDSDFYGNPTSSVYYSQIPQSGYVTDNTDCDDNEATINPQTIWYQDYDSDTLGNANAPTRSCTQPPGYVDNDVDLNDGSQYITDIPPVYFYRDRDGDGYGDPNDRDEFSIIPPGYTVNDQDCNDTDAIVNPDTVWYLDQDGDGFGYNASLLADSNTQRSTPGANPPPTGIPVTVTMCDPTTLNNGYGYVLSSNDYDDTLATITEVRPSYFYRDSDTDTYGDPNDSVFVSVRPSGYVTNDADCQDNDASLNPTTPWYLDSDGDGYGSDTVVNQCSQPQGGYVRNTDDYDDTTVNIINIAPRNFYRDADEDTYGDANDLLFYSEKPTGYVENDTDCDDANDQIHPNTLWYPDTDGDSYGDGNATPIQQCVQPTGYVMTNDDFDDTTVNIINIQPQYFYRDSDGDTYGDPNDSLYYSLLPSGYVENNNDCDDTNSSLNPDTIWYLDSDSDSFGDPNKTTAACIQPGGYVANSSDHDDSTIYITDITPFPFFRDKDNDGYGAPNDTENYSLAPPGYTMDDQDCNDADAVINPDTVWYLDQDGDGFGYNASLLSDSNTQRNTPGANQPPTGIPVTVTMCDPTTLNNGYSYVLSSNDYDDTLTTITEVRPSYFYRDSDTDTYGDPNDSVFVSARSSGYVANDADCQDNDASLNPTTPWYLDSDGDGYGSDTVLNQCSQPQGGYVRNTDDYDDTTVNIINIAPRNFYRDADEDTYGDANDLLFYSEKPTGYVENDSDCDDTSDRIHPNTLWYPDTDGDSYGDGNATPIQQCVQPTGYVITKDDFDDTTVNIINIQPRYFYRDSDGDTYGNPNDSVYYSLLPNGYVENSDDCDDTNSSLNPDTIWYLDSDNDSFGDPNKTTASCTQPGGYVANSSDHDDSTIYITDITPFPFFRDKDSDGYGDSNDTENYSLAPPSFTLDSQDCNDTDAIINPDTVWYLDQDGDGFGYNAGLLAQTNTARNTPGANQPPTGIPTTVTICDPTTLNNGYSYVLESNDYDDTLNTITNVEPRYFYYDGDGDNYGITGNTVFRSTTITPYVLLDGDCNDRDDRIHPQTRWYPDTDNDHYGDGTATSFTGCTPPTGYVLNNTDVDDNDSLITFVTASTFYLDGDSDGYGVLLQTTESSFTPPGYSHLTGDCNDNDPAINPATLWYVDSDGDGYGGDSSLQQCLQPGGYVFNSEDFDDSTTNITNMQPRDFFRDQDEDGYGTEDQTLYYSFVPEGYVPDAGDCDDTNPLLHPETHWYPDFDGDSFGDDNPTINCEPLSGFVPNRDDFDDTTKWITNIAPQPFYEDRDGDGYGSPEPEYLFSFPPDDEEGVRYVINNEDCDDTNVDLTPFVIWYLDRDGDGYGTEEATLEQCEPKEGYSILSGDCNDDNPSVFPGVVAAILSGTVTSTASHGALIDCNPAPTPEEIQEMTDTGSTTFKEVYADRDRDGFGDVGEPIAFEQVFSRNIPWATNADDACPEIPGDEMGCPEVLHLLSEHENLIATIAYQILLLFEDPTQEEPSEEKQAAQAAYTQEEINTVDAFPNPTQGFFTAKWEVDMEGFVEGVKVYGYNYGYEFTMDFVGSIHEVTIDLTEYPEDIYFVQFYFRDGRSLTKKIIKE